MKEKIKQILLIILIAILLTLTTLFMGCELIITSGHLDETKIKHTITSRFEDANNQHYLGLFLENRDSTIFYSEFKVDSMQLLIGKPYITARVYGKLTTSKILYNPYSHKVDYHILMDNHKPTFVDKFYTFGEGKTELNDGTYNLSEVHLY